MASPDQDRIANEKWPGKKYDELNTAQKQIVDGIIRTTGSGAESRAKQSVGGDADRPWRDVADWELIAAYRSGNVVNGKKVTQATLTAELAARGQSDEEITQAIQPGSLAKTLQEGAEQAGKNEIKAARADPTYNGGGKAKYDGPSEAELKKLYDAGKIELDEVTELMGQIYADKDPRLLELALSDFKPKRPTALEALRGANSAYLGPRGGTGSMGRAGDALPFSTGVNKGGQQEGFTYATMPNTGVTNLQGAWVPNAMSSDPNVATSSQYFDQATINEINRQRGFTGTGDLQQDLTAIGNYNTMQGELQAIPGTYYNTPALASSLINQIFAGSTKKGAPAQGTNAELVDLSGNPAPQPLPEVFYQARGGTNYAGVDRGRGPNDNVLMGRERTPQTESYFRAPEMGGPIEEPANSLGIRPPLTMQQKLERQAEQEALAASNRLRASAYITARDRYTDPRFDLYSEWGQPQMGIPGALGPLTNQQQVMDTGGRNRGVRGYAGGGGFMTDEMVGFFKVDPRTLKPKTKKPAAVAGEAGPEKIDVTPMRGSFAGDVVDTSGGYFKRPVDLAMARKGASMMGPSFWQGDRRISYRTPMAGVA